MNEYIGTLIEKRADDRAVSKMNHSDAVNEATQLLADYFDDIESGADYSDYEREDIDARLDRLADVITRLQRS